jgi:hypothetical protein
MLRGSADLQVLAQRAPVMQSLTYPAFDLHDVEVLYAVYELAHEGREALLPPGLHPTDPGHAIFVFMSAADSEFGPFTVASGRIGGRSGSRPRALELASFIDNPVAGEALRNRLGMQCDPATVRLVGRYSGAEASVEAGGVTIFRLSSHDQVTMTGADIQYTNLLTLAQTPMGLRLVQVEQEYTVQRATRGKPVLEVFVPEAWGSPLFRPVHGVSASLSRVDLSFLPIRFVQKPELTAFEGTERVAAPVPA